MDAELRAGAPLDDAMADGLFADGVGLDEEEAALVRSCMLPEDVERTEELLGVRVERVLTDSGMTWEETREALLASAEPGRRA